MRLVGGVHFVVSDPPWHHALGVMDTLDNVNRLICLKKKEITSHFQVGLHNFIQEASYEM